MPRELDRAREAPRDAARRTPAAAPAGPASAEVILQLQAQAGNAAVARLLQRETEITGEADVADPTDTETGSVNVLPTMADTKGPLDENDTLVVDPTPYDGVAHILHASSAPLLTHDAKFPGWRSLVELKPKPKPKKGSKKGGKKPPAPPSGFVPVTTLGQPKADLAISDGLYIENEPRAADVQQGMVGDCWDLAVVAAIAARDPAKIKAMVAEPRPGAFHATFWHKVLTRGNKYNPWASDKINWEQVGVTTSEALPFRVDKEGRAKTEAKHVRAIHGSQMLHAAHPLEKRWWIEIAEGGHLQVKSQAVYQVARWAPLLEKAYAIFAQRFGAYGGTGRDFEKKGGTTYAALGGGHSWELYGVFYGEQGDISMHPENVQPIGVGYDPKENLLYQNQHVIRKLLPLQGLPDQGSDPLHPGTAPLLTAGTSNEQMFQRLASAIDQLRGIAVYPAKLTEPTRGRIDKLRKELALRVDWQKDPERKWDQPLDNRSKVHISTSAQSVLRGHDGDDLLAARSDPAMGRTASDVVDLVLDVIPAAAAALGGPPPTAQRNIYGDHEYTVLSCRFVDSSGTTFNLTDLPKEAEPLKQMLAIVSEDKSTVRLRNPHHGGEPDEHGDAKPRNPDSGPGDDGIFNMTLRQFLVSFSSITSFNAPHT